jgi:hypothetical protein
MAERSLVDYVLTGMQGHWTGGTKHADAYTPGIADVSGYVKKRGNVFIELKALHTWPSRPMTPVKINLDALQREFLKERHGWLFLRVKRDYLLYSWDRAYVFDDSPGWPAHIMKAAANKTWKHKVDWKEFERCLNLKI